ncbi:dioxygenase family protein [Polyangium mundeleinium]|uniref:Protocatechuate 3,4-dioxygenase n=1 Tax=Polyangium mundeleinium TaxID=2995306 RepID=A0ABT5EG61_9BACT|nr:protocatechuate 3,4-dioxygenase [Polyangium mundeleinium]MDC0739751.1 protocatechuate 3,4-dioxygenase [Polyangium mundeleinium]
MPRHSKKDRSQETITRRSVLRGIGTALCAAPLVAFVGCGGTNENTGSGGAGGSGGTGGSGGSGGSGGTGGAGNGEWATGGTASMSGDYADPFTDDPGATCALVCAMTLGPCYAKTIVRKDISEGSAGLPMRLALRVVDETCKPIEGAEVDVWHTAATGLYSGDDSVEMCTGNDAEALAARWFRGVQTTDANGRVDFDSCFPGWYSSRTIHIHFTVRVGGNEYVTSQLFFPDELSDDIIASQPIYKDRGARDTTNENDTVISADAAADYTLQTKKMSDGALLAWKTLVIRSSLANALCQAPGGMGGPGGGPPPMP